MHRLVKLDDVDYHLFVMKDKDYVVKLMGTYGSLSVEDGTEDSIRCIIDDSQPNQRRRITFKHAENFRNYCRGRHVVDDHNHLRHLVPSIEGTWVTKNWENSFSVFTRALRSKCTT